MTTFMVADWIGSQGRNNQLPRLRLYATGQNKDKRSCSANRQVKVMYSRKTLSSERNLRT